MNELVHKYNDEWYKTYPLHSDFIANQEYFNKGAQENKEYWQCFNGKPDFTKQTVVDVGCGLGSLCIDIAVCNDSSKVIGVDTSAESIDFAKWNLHTNYRMLESRVEFHCLDVRQLPLFEVDAFLSKDSFEHINDLAEVLSAIKARLNVGGKLFTHFAPMYFSPFGGHPRIHDALPLPWLPWGHLLTSESYILSRVNSKREHSAMSVTELGLNKLHFRDFCRIFDESGLQVISLETNLPGISLKAKLMKALSRLSLLEKYTTYSLTSILEKTE